MYKKSDMKLVKPVPEGEVPYPDDEFVPKRGKRLQYQDGPHKPPAPTVTLPNGEVVELAGHEVGDDHE